VHDPLREGEPRPVPSTSGSRRWNPEVVGDHLREALELGVARLELAVRGGEAALALTQGLDPCMASASRMCTPTAVATRIVVRWRPHAGSRAEALRRLKARGKLRLRVP
jgi:hypothetical protein